MVDHVFLELHKPYTYVHTPAHGVEMAANPEWATSYAKGVLAASLEAAQRANSSTCRLEPGGLTTRFDDETYQNDGRPWPERGLCLGQP